MAAAGSRPASLRFHLWDKAAGVYLMVCGPVGPIKIFRIIVWARGAKLVCFVYSCIDISLYKFGFSIMCCVNEHL